MITFSFPGQGSQIKGMGGALFDEFKSYVLQADEILGYSIRDLCLEDSNSLLGQTQYTQPALFVVNALSYLKKIQETGKKPDFVIGHSLGEYNALFASGVFDFETGLRLVQKRGELMTSMAEGSMAAVIGLNEEQVVNILKQNNLNMIDIANLNTPYQIVISGPKADIDSAKTVFEACPDVSLYALLKTSGAFHSRYMEKAKNEFGNFISDFKLSEPLIPVISNVTARPYIKAETKNNIVSQIVSPVKWTESIIYLLNFGDMEFVEVGPGKVLTGLISTIQKDYKPTVTSSSKKETFLSKKSDKAKDKSKKEETKSKTDLNNDAISKKDIAIIGMECRFPGANSVEEFWNNLVTGKNSIVEIPPERWDWREIYGNAQKEKNKTNSKWGGFIEDLDKFDPVFFNISPKEASYMDPQHRIFLETVWKLFESSGYSAKSLSGKKIGVYAGVSKNDYSELLNDDISAFVSTGTVHSILANRISYFFNFRGPSEAVDTACSSSLVALHNAIRDIQLGECEAAVVGGVNALISPRMYISHAKSGMLSEDGQCKTFDESANGYVRAEGVGALFIKPLEKALEDRDNIIGVIKATAVNHGGRSNFLTAPNVVAQSEVVLDALKKAKADPRNISYIEAHGTGTSLGDTIEINALKKAYEQYYDFCNQQLEESNYCGIGSVKTNIGHLESAAGMASIIKVLLSMRHGVIPKLLNFNKLNPYIELKNSPFFIVKDSINWERRKIAGEFHPRQAAVSGFGMGGVNVHAILEEPPAVKINAETCKSENNLILLSSKKGQLKSTAQALLNFLIRMTSNVPIEDIAFTMMFGRDTFEERLAVYANSTEQFIDLLQKYINGETSENYVHGFAINKKDGLLEKVKATDDLLYYASKWVTGDLIDWDMSTFPGKRMALTGYPFLKQRCWFNDVNKNINKPPIEDKPSTKDFVKKIIVKDDCSMVANHLVQNKKTMPGMGYIELLLKVLSEDMNINNKHWSFKNVYWLKPAIFLDEKREFTVLFKLKQSGYFFQISVLGDVYCQGEVESVSNTVDNGKIDIQAIVKRCDEEESNTSLYKKFIENGLAYGPSFQVINKIYCGQKEAIAKIYDMTQRNITEILDGALQAVVRLSIRDKSNEDVQYVPYFLENLKCNGELEKLSYYYVKQQENSSESALKFDIYCCDDEGRIIATFENFVKLALHSKISDATDVYYYTAKWCEKEVTLDNSNLVGIMIINGDHQLEKFFKKKIEKNTQIISYKTSNTKDLCGEFLKNGSLEDFLSVFVNLKEKNCIPSHILVQSKNPGELDLNILLHLIRALIKAKIKESVKIVYFSMGANPEVLPYVHAASGLARTLKAEYPRIRLEIVSFDNSTDEYRKMLFEEVFAVFAPLHETRYLLNKRYQRKIVAVAEKCSGDEKLCLKKGGVYLFSGGAGGLGKLFSNYLAKNYQANLILLGRKAENKQVQAILDDISAAKGHAEYIETDISDVNKLEKVLNHIRSKYGRIDGVIQASGLIEDSFIINKTTESFKRVILPKINGTVNLDTLTASDNLDFFVMFSSVAALIPNQGQCDYSSGNSFIDSFSEYRNKLVKESKRNGISLAINWPLWESGGMQVTPEEKNHLWNVFGMRPLESNKGLVMLVKALEFSENQNLTQILGIQGDRTKINKHCQIENNISVELELVLPELLVSDLKMIISMVFHKPIKEISENEPLRELGVDSVSLLKISNMFSKFIGTNINPTLFFEYETISQLKEYLLRDKYNEVRDNYAKIGKTARLYRSTGLFDVEHSETTQGLYQRVYTNKEFYMVDHIVEEKFNVPGACYIEMARQAGVIAYPERRLAKLTNNYWAKQLSSSGEPFTVYIQLTDKENRVNYEIFSLEKEQLKSIYATGELIYENFEDHTETIESIDFKKIKERCSVSWSREHVYKQIHAEGLMVGPTLMPMQEIHANEDEALAILNLPTSISDTYNDYLLHPTILTGVFQTALMNNRFYGDDHKDYIPIAIDDLEIRDLILPECYVYCKARSINKTNPDMKKFDLMLCNVDGSVALILNGFAIKAKKANGQENTTQQVLVNKKSSIAYKSLDTILAQNYLKSIMSPVIGIEPSDIKSDEAFETYGINSVLILELNHVLEKHFGRGLSKTLFFEYRDLSELTEYFMENHKETLRSNISINQEPNELSSYEDFNNQRIENCSNPFEKEADQLNSVLTIDTNERPLISPSQDIAIIGLAGHYPQARTILEFWNVLKNAVDCIEEIRPDRFDFTPYYNPDKTQNGLIGKWGSFIDGVDEFDPTFFNISPREAELMDPQERLFLQVVWHTLEDAGYTRESLSSQKVGVFVGALWQPYQEAGILMCEKDKMIGPSSLLYNIANRVSYYCNFRGPSLAVDTACSASLTALHMACKSILSGESNLAIAGGVNLSIGQSKYMFLNQYKFLSSEGKCRSFGSDGDGYVPGEGVGAVLLKPLKQAQRDRDHIYGVIKATAVNHGGKTNGYSVPNPIAQSEVILETLKNANINPRNISYVEAHGTGTALGDPIEINGLTRSFSEYTKDKQFCSIGSVKSNIGHLEAAAGIAGLTKILLQMKYKKLVPSLHSETLNPYIDFSASPFNVQQSLVDWEGSFEIIDGKTIKHPRMAGLSSFGAGGSNAHAIVAEHLPLNQSDKTLANSLEPVLIILSAKSKEQLENQASLLKKAIDECNLTDYDLINMAYTLQVGREAMDERLAIIVSTVDELSKKLEAFIIKDSHAEGLIRGKIDTKAIELLLADESMQNTIESWILKKDYIKLSEFWVRGLTIDWDRTYENPKPYRISLPVYPFARERYWITESDENREISIKILDKPDFIHPLLHYNTSNFFDQRFYTCFDGQEFFLKDHVVKGKSILPGVVFIEMARAAVNLATETLANEIISIKMENIAWINPVVVNREPVGINIRLALQENGRINYEIYDETQKDKSPELLYSQGSVEIINNAEKAIIKIEDLKKECKQAKFSSNECYEFFKAMNAVYGSSLQGIQEVFVGKQKVLAKISLPTSVLNTMDKFVLHPSIMDSVLQLCLIIGASDISSFGNQIRHNPFLPFALEKLELIKKLKPHMWAYVRYSEDNSFKNVVRKLDIDICDEKGEVCVLIRGFSTRVLERDFSNKAESYENYESDENYENDETDITESTETVILSPEWHQVNVRKSEIFPGKENRILIIGGTNKEFNEIKALFPYTQNLLINPQDTIENLAEKLKDFGQIEHIVWMLPAKELACTIDDTLIAQQEHGVYFGFRLIKALLSEGYGEENLDWSIITTNTCLVNKADNIDPTHSGVQGLVGTMAKEYPNWNVRIFDLEKRESFSIYDIFTVNHDATGKTLALRNSIWYEEKLFPVQNLTQNEAPYRNGGVYVVIGGAGGIGEVWSEYVIKNFKAQVILIGRRQIDQNIQSKLDRLAAFGPAPQYITADATDLNALKQAYEEIKKKHPKIHGIIHSAIVLLDQSLLSMKENNFRACMEAKVNVSVRMAQVFKDESLDFFLFFSSINSFLKTPGQSNYVSGCIFKDTFAKKLEKELRCAVKVINWGYWGNVGIVSSKDYQEKMAKVGFVSINTLEAMKTLESLLQGSFNQLILLKKLKSIEINGLTNYIVKDEKIEILPELFPSSISRLQKKAEGSKSFS